MSKTSILILIVCFLDVVQQKYPSTPLLAFVRDYNQFVRDHTVADDESHLVAQTERNSENLGLIDETATDAVDYQCIFLKCSSYRNMTEVYDFLRFDF